MHLLELALIGAGDDIQPRAAMADQVQRRHHLCGHGGILQQRVDGGQDLDPLGDGRQGGHQHLRIQCVAPLLGNAAIAAPLGHRHDEIEPDFLSQNSDVTIIVVGCFADRRVGGEYPAAIGDGQENAEILAAAIRRQAEIGWGYRPFFHDFRHSQFSNSYRSQAAWTLPRSFARHLRECASIVDQGTVVENRTGNS